MPEARRNEVVSFVSGGLQDLSISRTTFDWGIKVPGDDRHLMYVLVDALTNSITEGLPREIELRQKQYAYYRDLLLSFPKPEAELATEA